MASWDRIKIGFDAEDETVNFGTRNVVHNAGYLYETSTFAVIEPQGEVEENPHVQIAVFASKSSPILCVAINRTVVLFSDENCTSQLVNLLFGSAIKCFTITQDGSFIILATSKNDLVCLDINSESIIYNRSFSADMKTGSSFVQLLAQSRRKDDDAYYVLAVCDSGQIWRISLMLPNSATDEADVQCCCVRTCNTNEISSATIFTSMSSSVVVMTGRQLILWVDGVMDECINLEDEYPALVKVQEFQNSWLVCLTEGGKLALVCPNTLAICSVFEDLLVHDFTVRANYDESSILLLTRPNAQGEAYIHYATLPDFGTKYRVKVSATSYLVPGSSEFIFLEGAGCNEGSDIINALSFKIVAESRPLDRLLHILRRKRFQEAETFAQQFNLDLDLVYKAHSQHLVEMLYSHSNEDSFRELIALLDKIHDIKFVSEICQKAITADLAAMKELLKYGFSRLTLEQKQGRKDGVDTGPLLSQLTSMLFHLETYEIINESDSSDVMEWLDFSSADLWQVCVNLLKQGKMTRAALIWSRHSSHLKNRLNIDRVLSMLDAIPVNVDMSSLLQWLNYFVPCIVSTYPQALDCLMNWAWKKVRCLEVSENQWPDTAVNFVEDMLKLVSRNYHTGLDNLYQCSSSKVVVQQLTFLQNSLREIKKLRTTYYIHITLEDYMQDDKYEVVHCILSKLYHYDLHVVLNGFVKQYMLKYNLDWDTMIVQHIDLIIKSMTSLYGDQISDVGEQAVAILIGNIHNVSARIHCILEVLKAAPVPWSNTVTLLAEQGLQLNHPLVAEIRTQQHLIAAKIVFKKYNFDLQYLNSSSFKTSLFLIRRIMKQGEKDMLKEALLIADKSVRLCEEAYMLCIDSYIERDEEIKALEIVHSLEPDLFKKCCERIKCRILAEGQSDVGYKFMNLLYSTSIKFKKTEGDCDVPLKEVKNIYRLKSEFEMQITLSEYSCKNDCLNFFTTCISNLIVQLPAKPYEDDIKNLCTKARGIAQLFQFSPDDGLIEAYQQVLKSNSSSLVASAMAYILMKYGGSSVFNDKLLDLVNQQLLADPKSHFIQAAARLAMKATAVCSTATLHGWLNLVQHTEFLLSALPDPGGIDQNHLKKWTFTALYRDSSVFTKNELLVQFIQDRLLSSQHTREEMENSQSEVSKILSQLSKDLVKEHLDILLLKLIISIAVQGLLNFEQTQTIEINALMVQVVKLLIIKVISFRQFDVEFGLCLICTLDSNLALQCLGDILQTYKQNYQKLSLIAKLGMLYTVQMKLMEENQHFTEIYVKCLWTKKLTELQFPYKEAYIESQKAMLLVLQKLMQNPKVDITLLQEFCADFCLDLQEYLILYLEMTILSWEPQLETKTNGEGTTEIVVKNDEASVIKRCTDIINRMEDRSGLEKCLHSLWHQINFYYYEMYICIEMLQEMIPSKEAPPHYRFLLLFLKKYKRLRRPQQEETQKWLNYFPDTDSLPKISEWRLPFLLLVQGDPWKVIMPELKLNTYKQWLSAASIINVDADSLCSIVVRETVADLKTSESVSEEWCLHAEHANLLNEVEHCISHITDTEKAGAAYYCIMTHLPPGVDKLKAAKLCYAHTKKWAAQSDNQRSRECLQKVQKTYLHLATKHILYRYNLRQRQYIKLSTQPQQLITELYKDPTIVERVRGCASQCPDINAATKEIAALHNIALLKLCREMIDDWLMPVSTFHRDMSDENTANMTSTFQNCRKLIEEDENNMLRLCYLLKWEEMSPLIDYLIPCVFLEDSQCSISFKLRALRCLLSIKSEEQLIMDTNLDTETIRKKLWNLQYTYELEALGFIYSVEEFEACSKLSLVNSVLAREAFNPGALLFVSRLCLAYEIRDIQVWEPLLSHMMKLSMVKELEEVLLQFCEQSTVHVKAWDYILLKPFVRAELPLSEEQTEACMHSLIMLQSCPLTSSVKLKDLSKHCMRINSPHMAAVLLPYLDRKERTRLKQEIELVCDSKLLQESVKKLQHEGILIVPKILQILQEPGTHCI